jgi:hypothetical protein
MKRILSSLKFSKKKVLEKNLSHKCFHKLNNKMTFKNLLYTFLLLVAKLAAGAYTKRLSFSTSGIKAVSIPSQELIATAVTLGLNLCFGLSESSTPKKSVIIIS